MAGLFEPARSKERDSTWRSIVVATVLLVAVVLGIALIWREPSKPRSSPPPYASQLQLSDLKMSQAQNFVGTTVT
jgi:anti-sigma-K factor RskA